MNLYNIIIDKFGTPLKVTRKGSYSQYEFNCPFCSMNGKSPDTKGHLSVRSDGIYNCYRCGASGRLRLPETPLNPDIDSLLSDIKSVLVDKNEDIYEVVEYPISNLPIESSKIALKYMMDRGFTLEQLHYYNCKVGMLGSAFFGRVIIPNEMLSDRTTDMFTARSYLNDKKRYINPPGASASNVVFNLHRIPDNCDQIIICEGPLTAMSAGKDAVALYGKSYLNKLDKILAKNPKKVVVNLDPDAKVNAIGLCNAIKSLNSDIDLRMLILPEGTDANDYLKSNSYDKYRYLVDTAPKFDLLTISIGEGLC